MHRKKRSEAGALQKQKPTPFLQQDRRNVERRNPCFFVVLKYRDPSREKIFKGPSGKIFFLTLTSKYSQRTDFFCLKSV
jgi:hypothetical protein